MRLDGKAVAPGGGLRAHLDDASSMRYIQYIGGETVRRLAADIHNYILKAITYKTPALRNVLQTVLQIPVARDLIPTYPETKKPPPDQGEGFHEIASGGAVTKAEKDTTNARER